MIRTQDIMKSLPLVASILGDKYGVKVNIGGEIAYTDGKTINLPTLPLDCDEILLRLAKGFCDHEASHIRHTDFAALRAAKLTPMQKHLWNAIMSGSRMELASRACYAVAAALERVGVNVGVTAFPAVPTQGGNENTVAPLVRHGERMHDRFCVRCGGGTPLPRDQAGCGVACACFLFLENKKSPKQKK